MAVEVTVDPEVAKKVDRNGDGHISQEEMEMNLEFKRKELEDADARRDAMRKMTWFALMGMLLYPAGILITSMLGYEETAKIRIKTGLILNEFGEQNQIKVNEQEIQNEVQKQIRMMPGQEKMVMDFYQKNPSALASLRGTVYEEKILNLIKEKGKAK